MNKWQPIKTAPRDGSEVLVWRKDCGVLLARWTCCADFLTEDEIEDMLEEEAFQEDWFYADFVCGGRLDGDLAPVEWLPLPEKPE